ncbi:hypothetical protein ACP70R_040458 [Stipagrostis hirtigluma subsp. patula]
MASCSGSNTFLGGGLPVKYEWSIHAGFTTAPYACGLPCAPVQPSAAGSWWCGGPEVWSF